MQTGSSEGSDGVKTHQPKRDRQHSAPSNRELLSRYPIGKFAPMDVLEKMLRLFNKMHIVKQKDVSFKTQRERAMFLRRFFRELRERGGFSSIPDPRNVSDRHIRAMIEIWQRDNLAPGTVQTYLSYLRALAIWIDKPGLVKPPEAYGLTPEEYKRHDASNVDKSWSGHHVDIDALLLAVKQYDMHVGAMLCLIRAFGLRKKEAIMFRPCVRVVSFEETRLPPELRKAERYISIMAGSKGGRLRYIPLDSPERIAAIEHAQSIVTPSDGHMGQPGLNLKQAMRRFDYVMWRFGITGGTLGVTAHGLRHEALIDHYEAITGDAAPVRGGGKGLPKQLVDAARKEVAILAGHNRKRASGAYLGALRKPSLKNPGPTSSPDADKPLQP